jgi:hypothetical protein
MTFMRLTPLTVVLVVATLAVGGCGSSSKSKPAGGGSAEAKSAATGDIPDNQAFLSHRDRAVGYSLSYPEGWSRSGASRHLTFRDKGNSVHLEVAPSRPPSPATVRSRLAGGGRTIRSAPKRVALKHGGALKAAYSYTGPPDPVTGKRSLLLVDRYVYARGREVATLDLSTPKGVDNVDAFRMIANSFRWR